MALPTVRTAIRGDIDSLFDRFWSDWNLPLAFEYPSTPSLDLYEKDGAFCLELAVPGYRSEDIEIEANSGVITVSGKYEQKTADKELNYHRREIRRGGFTRSVALPQEIDPGSVTAKVEHGILTVTATPMKPVANRKIAITTG